MKGIIFNLLEAHGSALCGEDAWDDALQQCALEGAYTAIGNYPDEEFVALLSALPLAGDTTERLRDFGRSTMVLLADRYPVFFTGHDGSLPFMRTLNDVIHSEVRKLYPGANVPVFDFDEPEPGTLLMGYHSQRGLCALAEGFALGAADQFNEDAVVTQDQCTHDGAAHCVLRISVRPRRHG